jgi:hypothetical protein
MDAITYSFARANLAKKWIVFVMIANPCSLPTGRAICCDAFVIIQWLIPHDQIDDCRLIKVLHQNPRPLIFIGFLC